jgi:hypothetical protein
VRVRPPPPAPLFTFGVASECGRLPVIDDLHAGGQIARARRLLNGCQPRIEAARRLCVRDSVRSLAAKSRLTSDSPHSVMSSSLSCQLATA